MSLAAGGWRGAWQNAFRDIPAHVFTGVGWQYGGTLTGSAISFLYTLLVAGALGAAEFGLMALGLAYAAILSQFSVVQLREVVIRYAAKFHEENDGPRLYATAKASLLVDAAAGAAALALIMALSPVAKAFLIKDERAYAVIALAGCAYVFQNVADDTAIGLLRVFSKFRTIAFIEVAANLVKLAGALTVVWLLGWGVLGVLLVLLASHLLMNLAMLATAVWYLHNRVPLRTHAPLSLLGPYRVEMTRFLRNNYFRSLTNFTTRDLDVNLLGFFETKATVGVYKVARSFFVVLYQLADAAFLVVYPELARLWSRGRFAELRRFIKRFSLIMGGSGVVLYAAAFFAVPWMIRLLMRPEFAEAGTLFRSMGWGIVLCSPFVWVAPLLLAAGRSDLMLRATLIHGIVVTALYVAACAAFGALGAALVNALTHGIFVLIALWSGRRAGIIFPAGDTIEPDRVHRSEME